MTDDPKILTAVGVTIVAIVAISIGVVLNDHPATRAAENVDTTASIRPSVPIQLVRQTPAPYARRPIEQAPVAVGAVPGDGTWILGQDLQRGVYRSAGGRSCQWVRLQAEPPWTVGSPPDRLGPQVVTLGGQDVAFASQGCAGWVRVR
jgi:hypothetical protein